ncbi:hypothetical protein C9890_0400 [Perkinsus sp. BL_2016]|nr:hypothetical protein C9890_0400 [Perkinsus sp. BL_2016]
MDTAWKSIKETTSLSGPHGISWPQFIQELGGVMKLTEKQLQWPPGPALKYLLEIYACQLDGYAFGKYPSEQRVKDPKTKLIYFADLEPVTITNFDKITSPDDLRFYCPNSSIRRAHLFQGRPIQLSESSLQALEVIASHGQKGLTQAELAKVLGCDSKNAFHWLKSLIANDLIVRTPVASKKAFTYLLTLTRYLDNEISLVNSTETHTVVSSKEIRQRIVDILAKAPDQTMVSKDVFAQAGLDHFLIKHFRRAATKLNEIGWLEYLFEDQLVGPYCRLFRLKRKPGEGLDLNSFLVSLDKSKIKNDSDDQIKTPSDSHFHLNHPIINQIILLLARSHPEPLTTCTLSNHLNISRKYLYKLIDRILPVSAKKVGVIGAEGVEKVVDFVGKEKRLRLFIKSEEWRDYYLKLFNMDEADNSTNISLPASRPSTPVPVDSSSVPSDTRTRILRHQALLQELSFRKVLEVGRDLCNRLQALLGDTRFTLDVKTLRRSVEILEKEGKLKVVITSVPQGIRTILISPELNVTDEIVQNYITKMNEYVRAAPLSANTVKMNQLKEAMQDPNYFIEGSLPLGVPQNPSNNLRALIQFGFVHGVMSRAQIFHEYLLSRSNESNGFETIPIIFDQMPLGIYMKLIGLMRISRGLFESLQEYDVISVSNLPEIYREELALNRKRFQSQVSILLGILEELKLIEGEEHFSSLNFRFPLKYNFPSNIPLYNYNGEIVKIINFKNDQIEKFNEFWMGMRQICSDYHSRHVSIHEAAPEAMDFAIPKPVLLARYPDSWKQRPSRERDLERAVRKFSIESFAFGKSMRRQGQETSIQYDTETFLTELALEFEVPKTRIQTMFSNFIRLLEEREEAKRLDKLSSRSKESDSEDSDSDELDHFRWSKSDWTRLSLAFCILQQPQFLTTSTNPIKWNLAAQIFDKPKSPTIIRRHGLKLFKNYEELRRMIELDTIVNLIIRGMEVHVDDCEDLSVLFKSIFDKCQQVIDSSEQDDLFDCFRIDSHSQFCVLQSRQEHFVNSIDTWVQTRSFRHGLLLNHPGTVEKEHLNLMDSFSDDNIVFLMRQILVSSTTDQFNFESFTEIIKTIAAETLTNVINQLVGIGFASKNRLRDKCRLFSFPLVISETTREVIEYTNLDQPRGTLVVDSKTETLSISRIEQFIESSLSGLVEIKALQPQVSLATNKCDTPIEINTRGTTEFNFNLDGLRSKSYSNSIWFTPSGTIFLGSIAIGCLNHLTAAIKSQPGTTIQNLRARYNSILEGFEFDALLECLIENDRIELIESKFLLIKP